MLTLTPYKTQQTYPLIIVHRFHIRYELNLQLLFQVLDLHHIFMICQQIILFTRYNWNLLLLKL